MTLRLLRPVFSGFFAGQGGCTDKKEKHSREKFYGFPEKSNESTVWRRFVSKRRVRALFSTYSFRYFAPTTRMYADIRGSGIEWNKAKMIDTTMDIPCDETYFIH